MNSNFQHKPVMVKEVLQYLDPQAGQTIIDCTFGFGGHAQAILKEVGNQIKLIGTEADREVFSKVAKEFVNYPVKLVNDNFRNLKKILENQGETKVDRILFDLGVSSFHFDSSGRGFSFSRDGPLDMRLDQSKGQSAADIVNGATKEELAELFFTLADERYSRQIAKAIYDARQKGKIATTSQLAEIIAGAKPKSGKINPATQVFQALRIAVNDEFNSLSMALEAAVDVLKIGGRVVAISFHSGEDRIVKGKFKQFEKDGKLKILTKKPAMPSYEEIKTNPRARSARLRAAIKS